MDYSDPTKFMDVSQYMRPKEQLVAMGFPEGAAEATLAAHGGDFEAAANALAASAPAAAPAAASLAAPPAPPPPDVDTKAPRPRNVLMAEFEGPPPLSKADASQALRDAGGDLDKARTLLRSRREASGTALLAQLRREREARRGPPPAPAAPPPSPPRQTSIETFELSAATHQMSASENDGGCVRSDCDHDLSRGECRLLS